MSTVSTGTESPPVPPFGKDAIAMDKLEQENKQPPAHYKGFVAGIFSGVAKLTVGHP
jgi:hypothetical protein